jgi:kynurenine formamidase
MSGPPRLVDLSVTLGPNASERVPVEINYMSHAAGGAHLAELVGMPREQLHQGLGWSSERVSAITHAGTHVDAPSHYSPFTAGGRARTIDELPIEWFWGPACCVRVPGPPDSLVSANELVAWEEACRHVVPEKEIVLFDTGAARAYGSDHYSSSGRALSADLVRLLVSRGVRVFGTDAWSIDPCYPIMRERLGRLGPASVWAAHYVGREAEFCVIERLFNLDGLPPAGFQVACFPIKVARGSAGWVRAVAFLPGDGT